MTLNFRKGSAFATKKARQYLKDKKPENFNNITVIRHAAIGDFMNIRPFLIELRSFFKNAKITISTLRSTMYGLPKDLVDEIHIIDKDNPNNRSKKTGLLTRIKQAKTLPPQDIIFDLTDSTLSVLLVKLTKADLKIGYPYRSIRRMFFDIATLRSDFTIETQSTLHMLNILGLKKISKLNYGFINKYPKKDAKEIVYFAGASIKAKRWENEKFSKLITKLSLQYPDYRHIILQGINKDEKFLDIYEPLKNQNNIILKRAMDYDSTMQFLANCRCVISNDTGIRNMAIALNTPTIGVFFLTAPFRYWPDNDMHECAFNFNYISPDIKQVYDIATKLLTKLYA